MAVISSYGTLIDVGTVEAVTFVANVTGSGERSRIISACRIWIASVINNAFIDVGTVEAVAFVTDITVTCK